MATYGDIIVKMDSSKINTPLSVYEMYYRLKVNLGKDVARLIMEDYGIGVCKWSSIFPEEGYECHNIITNGLHTMCSDHSSRKYVIYDHYILPS